MNDQAPDFATDHLPLGKQSVAVTVDVQAPPSMNLYQPATLKLLVKNTGSTDAMNVHIFDELPDGLQYISSQPEAHVAGESSLLSWRMNTLPAGSEHVITIKVKPVKTGPFDHGATALFKIGSKSRTLVLQPRLKVEQTVSPAKVLKGQQVEFKVRVTNVGDGPARDVRIQAKLTPGLRHGSGERGDEQTLELTLPDLASGQHEELDPLVVDAIQGGEQSCTVTAESPDVVSSKNDAEGVKGAESVKTVLVVEPKLQLTLKGPDKRYTDTVAAYQIKVENPGTAPARKVRVAATLPVSGRPIKVPPEARWDNTTRRLEWSLNQVEPGKSLSFDFEVLMGGIGFYEVTAEARGEGALSTRGTKSTDVVGMSDVDLVVSERRRVLDVGDKTSFQIRLRNYGTKDATHLQIKAQLSKNLKVVGYAGPTDQAARFSTSGDGLFEFPIIDQLGRGKEVPLGITVQVEGDNPKLATCKVFLTHDDLPEGFDDMAAVKVMPSRQAAADGP
jgi:uncharacterized repeat protein (TIGR01451 family)